MEPSPNPNLNSQVQQWASRKAQMMELEQLIRRERDRNPAILALLQLLNLRFEAARDNLFRANPQTFAPFQGEARALADLIEDLTTDPPALPPKENYT